MTNQIAARTDRTSNKPDPALAFLWFLDTVTGPIRRVLFSVLLPNGPVVRTEITERLLDWILLDIPFAGPLEASESKGEVTRVLDRIIEYMIRRLFLVSTLSLVSLVMGQAKTIEGDQLVDVTGTITHDYSGKKAIKMEHFYLTSGDTVIMNDRHWPVKKIEIVFRHNDSVPYKATMKALNETNQGDWLFFETPHQ
jgi:hypothetical protein